MVVCASCGKEVREGASFCTSCGSPVAKGSGGPTLGNSSDKAQIPLITLAPQQSSFSKGRVKRTVSVISGVLLVVLVALGAVFVSAWLKNSPVVANYFPESEMSSDKYQQCLALVQDVRNDALDDYIADIINKTGKAEDFNFVKDYEQSFKEIMGPDCTETEKVFRQCCLIVSYTEFCAKRDKYFAENGLFGGAFKASADKYRRYADQLWDMLISAESMSELQNIIKFAEDNDIMHLKK